MIPREHIEAILTAAVQATSGHNSQPWKFRVVNDTITFINVPENDRTIYNYKQRGSYIAHGAALENALVAAESFGYQGTVRIASEEQGDEVLSLHLSKGEGSGRAALFDYINARATNRKPYEAASLLGFSVLPEDLRLLGNLAFIEDKERIARIAEAMSINDWLIFNSPVVHDAIFPHIIWDEKTEKKSPNGIFIDTLELPPPVRSIFNIIKYPTVARLFGLIGFGNIAAKQNVETVYTKTAAIGIISVSELSKQGLVAAGRLLEYVWLSATKAGLSLQPLVGAYYLSLRATEDQEFPFSDREKLKLAEALKIFIQETVEGEVPAIFFRIGKSSPPSARSSKKLPVIINP